MHSAVVELPKQVFYTVSVVRSVTGSTLYLQGLSSIPGRVRGFSFSFIQAKLLVICECVFASGPFRIELNQYHCPPSVVGLAMYVCSY